MSHRIWSRGILFLQGLKKRADVQRFSLMGCLLMVAGGVSAEEILCDLRGTHTLENIHSYIEPQRSSSASLSVSMDMIKDGYVEKVRNLDFNFLEGDFDYAPEHENYESVVSDRTIRVIGSGVAENDQLPINVDYRVNEFSLSTNRFSGRADLHYNVQRCIDCGAKNEDYIFLIGSLRAQGDCASFARRKF